MSSELHPSTLSTSHARGVERWFPVSYDGKGEQNSEYQAPVGYTIEQYDVNAVTTKDGGYLRFTRFYRADADVDLTNNASNVNDSDRKYGAGIGGNAAHYTAEVGAYASATTKKGRSTQEQMKFNAKCDILYYLVGGTTRKSSVSGRVTVILTPVAAVAAPTQISHAPKYETIAGLVQSVSPNDIANSPSQEKIRGILIELHVTLRDSHRSYCERFANEGGIASTVSAMQMYTADPDVQQYGIMVLYFPACLCRQTGIAQKFASTRAIQQILAAMHEHLKVPEIQMHGMLTLYKLAELNENKRKILNLPYGLANIVEDLDVEDVDEQVCVAFCMLLDILVSAEDWRVLKGSAEGSFGVANVVPAMLRLLVYTDPSTDPCMESRTTIVQKGGLSIILRIMERFPNSPDVQVIGASALRGLARSQKTELVPSFDRIRSLVRKAKNDHSDPGFQKRFQEISDDLMSALSGNKYRSYYIPVWFLAMVLAVVVHSFFFEDDLDSNFVPESSKRENTKNILRTVLAWIRVKMNQTVGLRRD